MMIFNLTKSQHLTIQLKIWWLVGLRIVKTVKLNSIWKLNSTSTFLNMKLLHCLSLMRKLFMTCPLIQYALYQEMSYWLCILTVDITCWHFTEMISVGVFLLAAFCFYVAYVFLTKGGICSEGFEGRYSFWYGHTNCCSGQSVMLLRFVKVLHNSVCVCACVCVCVYVCVCVCALCSSKERTNIDSTEVFKLHCSLTFYLLFCKLC